MPPEVAQKIGEISKASHLTDCSIEELEQRIVDGYNATKGTLPGVDCPICNNKGDIMVLDPITLERKIRDCQCQAQRRSLRFMADSGLGAVLDLYTWDKWQSREPWQEKALEAAKNYAANPEGWFLAAGRSGTGKTHLCTAICGELLRGCRMVRYLQWRDFSVQAKAVVNDDVAYRELVDPYKRVHVLYIDDLFKTGKGQAPTSGDCNLAFELINARYNNPDKLTIISTELSIRQLLDIDEAIGSRIYERAKGHYLDLSNRQNWRTR
jgi:DNA replication protein DnaC